MGNTISIKKEFSIYNEDYIQYIIEMENGVTWSIAQVDGNWNIIECSFDPIKKEIYNVHGLDTTLPSINDVRDFIWRKTNNIELGEEVA